MAGGVVYLCSMVCRIVLHSISDAITGSLTRSFYNHAISTSSSFFSRKRVPWTSFPELNEVTHWMDDATVFE